MKPRFLVSVLFVTACNAGSKAKPSEDMVFVPPGQFIAGCDPTHLGENDSCKGDLPRREEVIKAGFWIDRMEVTVEAYEQCFRAGPCADAAKRATDDGARSKGFPPSGFGDKQKARHPIQPVSADEARTYCAWVKKRLPTEIEWEKAARGTDGRPYPWGSQPPSANRLAHVAYLGVGNMPVTVGSCPAGASPYGALDMVGNVDEWVETTSPSNQVVHMGEAMSLINERNTFQVLGHRTIVDDTLRPVFLSGFRCARDSDR